MLWRFRGDLILPDFQCLQRKSCVQETNLPLPSLRVSTCRFADLHASAGLGRIAAWEPWASQVCAQRITTHSSKDNMEEIECPPWSMSLRLRDWGDKLGPTETWYSEPYHGTLVGRDQSKQSRPEHSHPRVGRIRNADMATTMRAIAPQARLGSKVSIKAPSQAKAFGLGVPKARRSAAQFKCMAFNVTLKLEDGSEQSIECDGELRALYPVLWLGT